MTVWYTRDLKLRHEVVELSDGSSSIIRFTIHPNSTHLERWIKGSHVDSQNETQIVEGSKVVEVDEDQFMSNLETYSTAISNMIPSSLRIDSWARQCLVKKIIIEARLDLLHYSLYNSYNGSVGNRLWMTSVEIHMGTIYELEKEHAMVQSIVDLEEGRSSCCCAICLEEISAETHVACMPCFHVFHNYCIVQWLSMSHHCPICRFEMPTVTN
ncbi:hypothetical protein ACB092_12G171100 [Castanea dentata]